MQISVRDSYMVAQKPDFASIGTFVVRIATLMSIYNGIAVRLASSPAISIAPPTISTIPTSGAKNRGSGIPMLAKRPAPAQREREISGCPQKQSPSRKRPRMVAHGALLLIAKESRMPESVVEGRYSDLNYFSRT